MSRDGFAFTHRFRIRYAEVDAQAVVFNSRYLEYADLVLTEYWRGLGLNMDGDMPLEVHVARAVVDYKKPIRFDEEIDGLIRTARIGRSSIVTEIALYAADDLRATIELVHVHVDLASGVSIPVPEAARARLMPG